jgi:hypothetical protein
LRCGCGVLPYGKKCRQIPLEKATINSFANTATHLPCF